MNALDTLQPGRPSNLVEACMMIADLKDAMIEIRGLVRQIIDEEGEAHTHNGGNINWFGGSIDTAPWRGWTSV